MSLLPRFNEGDLVLDKKVFRLDIKHEVAKFATHQEIPQQGDFFWKQLQAGISVAFLNFGLCKKITPGNKIQMVTICLIETMQVLGKSDNIDQITIINLPISSS